jgi:hypothetical protein
MVDVVITAVVVRVVSNDKLVVKVNAPAVMTAGYWRRSASTRSERVRKRGTNRLTPVNEATVVPVLVVVDVTTSQLSLEVAQSDPTDPRGQSWTRTLSGIVSWARSYQCAR